MSGFLCFGDFVTISVLGLTGISSKSDLLHLAEIARNDRSNYYLLLLTLNILIMSKPTNSGIKSLSNAQVTKISSSAALKR